MLYIRLATDEDVPDICRIVQQMSPGSPHDYRNAVEKFRKEILPSKDYFLWVAVDTIGNKEIVCGTAMMHLQHKLSYHCGTAAHLEDVVVDDLSRGIGIGEMLVNTAIECAKEHDCYKIMLTCFEKTTKYYEKFGFEIHDIGMRKELKELYPKG